MLNERVITHRAPKFDVEMSLTPRQRTLISVHRMLPLTLIALLGLWLVLNHSSKQSFDGALLSAFLGFLVAAHLLAIWLVRSAIHQRGAFRSKAIALVCAAMILELEVLLVAFAAFARSL